MRFSNKIVFTICICIHFITIVSAQEKNVFKVNGPNIDNLYAYLRVWIDTTKNASFTDVAAKLSNDNLFDDAYSSKKNIGLNPYSTWYYLKIENNSEIEHNYWWSFYTHADSLYVFRKKNWHWVATDTLFRNQLLRDRKVKTRALSIPVFLEYKQKQEIVVKLINKRHTQNAFTDLTTPEHHLLWEKQFYWSVGFFIGTFLIMSLLSLILWIIQRKNVFLFFFFYLLVVIIIALSEELMNTIVSQATLFWIINRFHSLPLALLAVCINYSIVSYIFQDTETEISCKKIFDFCYKLGLFCSLFSIVIYFLFMNQLHFGQIGYTLFWKINLYLIFVIVAITVLKIILLSLQSKNITAGIFFVIIMLLFNPAGYFLNYSGILNYYEITYPNYFYWVVCVEFIFIGVLIAWRFQKTAKIKFQLEIENANYEERMMHRELNIQNQERQQIARDLHDDLGATISAIKLWVTNNYEEDKILIDMITNASNDIRGFYKKLAIHTSHQNTIKDRINTLVALYQNISPIEFSVIFIGNESLLSNVTADTIFKICNEIVTNILKHAQAKEVTIQILIDEEIQLIIEDNGVGFDLDKAMKGTGMGLKNIHQRVKNRNGEVHISSTKGNTTIIINIPLHEN
ncbi:ATP-binding protein [Flavobacterium sp. J27]|uniref:ATP-binding protein n=1 Tax=Flavobacterium sp. J27 TaxID=2060419 RepID=UPI00102FD138|nr:ATP-binding protein [Flavobacterium sp. J27]